MPTAAEIDSMSDEAFSRLMARLDTLAPKPVLTPEAASKIDSMSDEAFANLLGKLDTLKPSVTQPQASPDVGTIPGGMMAQAGIGLQQGFSQLGQAANKSLEISARYNPVFVLAPHARQRVVEQLAGASEIAGKRAQELEELGKQTEGPRLPRVIGAGAASLLPSLAAAPLGFPAMVASAGLQSFGGTAAEAEQANVARGMSPDEAQRKALLPAAASAAITSAITALFGRTGTEAILNTVKAGGARQIAKSILREAGFEGAEELYDQVGQAVVQKLSYRPEITLPQAFQEATEAGLVGSVLGGGVTGLRGVSALGQAPGQQRIREANEPAPIPLPPPLPAKPPPLPQPSVAPSDLLGRTFEYEQGKIARIIGATSQSLEIETPDGKVNRTYAQMSTSPADVFERTQSPTTLPYEKPKQNVTQVTQASAEGGAPALAGSVPQYPVDADSKKAVQLTTTPYAIPQRKPAPLPVSQPPESSAQVGAQVRDAERPAVPQAPQEAKPAEVAPPDTSPSLHAILSKQSSAKIADVMLNGEKFVLGVKRMSGGQRDLSITIASPGKSGRVLTRVHEGDSRSVNDWLAYIQKELLAEGAQVTPAFTTGEQRKTTSEQKSKASVDRAFVKRFGRVPTPTESGLFQSLQRLETVRYKTAQQEKQIKLIEQQIAANPDKWSVGDGVGWRVVGNQINRGFRIVSVDPEAKTVVVRQVADTGLTTSGGDTDVIQDQAVEMSSLVRDKKFNAPTERTPDEVTPTQSNANAAAAEAGVPPLNKTAPSVWYHDATQNTQAVLDSGKLTGGPAQVSQNSPFTNNPKKGKSDIVFSSTRSTGPGRNVEWSSNIISGLPPSNLSEETIDILVRDEIGNMVSVKDAYLRGIRDQNELRKIGKQRLLQQAGPSPLSVPAAPSVQSVAAKAAKRTKNALGETVKQEFDKLVLDYVALNNVTHDPIVFQPVKELHPGAKSTHNAEVQRLRRVVLSELGIKADAQNSEDLSAALPKLKASLSATEATRKQDAEADEAGAHTETEGSTEFLPRGEELFAPSERPFNLVSDKPMAPSAVKSAAPTERLTQQEMFDVRSVVSEKDPELSANAAQKLYGDPATAADKLERQLAVLDTNKGAAKEFTNEQRKRFPEVVALLRQRASVPKPVAFPPELAKQLLALSREAQTSGYGPQNESLRQDILEALTGTRPPKSKSGAKAVESALAKHFGIDAANLSGVEVEEAIRDKLGQVASPPDIIKRLEAKKIKPGGAIQSTLIPGLDPETARSVWNTAIDIAQQAIRAGRAIRDAIQAAIDYIKSQTTEPFDEAEMRRELEGEIRTTEVLGEKIPVGGTLPKIDRPAGLQQAQQIFTDAGLATVINPATGMIDLADEGAPASAAQANANDAKAYAVLKRIKEVPHAVVEAIDQGQATDYQGALINSVRTMALRMKREYQSGRNAAFSENMVNRLFAAAQSDASFRGKMLSALSRLEKFRTALAKALFLDVHLSVELQQRFDPDGLISKGLGKFRDSISDTLGDELSTDEELAEALERMAKKSLPNMRDMIKTVFALPEHRRGEAATRFAENLAEQFNLTPAQKAEAERIFKQAYNNKFEEAKTKALEQAYKHFTPKEQVEISRKNKKSKWSKLETVVNSGFFDDFEAYKRIAILNGWKINESDIAKLKSLVAEQQKLTELTPEERAAAGNDPETLARKAYDKAALNQGRIGALEADAMALWARLTKPLGANPRLWRNNLEAFASFVALNMLTKLSFAARQAIDVSSQKWIHPWLRSVASGIEQYKNLRDAGESPSATDALNLISDGLADALFIRSQTAKEARAKAVEVWRGRERPQRVIGLENTVAYMERLSLRGRELKAEAEALKGRTDTASVKKRAWNSTQRLMNGILGMASTGGITAGSFDNWQGTPAKWEEFRHLVTTELTRLGVPRSQRIAWENQIIGDVASETERATQDAEIMFPDAPESQKRAAAGNLMLSRMLERASGISINEEKLDVETMKERMDHIRDYVGWNIPEGGLGAVVTLPIKVSAKVIPFLPLFQFANAMARAINMVSSWSGLGILDAFGIGPQSIRIAGIPASPGVRYDSDRMQRGVEGAIGLAGWALIWALLGGDDDDENSTGPMLRYYGGTPADQGEAEERRRRGIRPYSIGIRLGDEEAIWPVSQTPLIYLSPQLGFFGTLQERMAQKRRQRDKLNAEAKQRGLPEDTTPIAPDSTDIVASIAGSLELMIGGGRTAAGKLGAVTDLRAWTREPETMLKRATISQITPMGPLLPGWNNLARAMGANINSKTANLLEQIVQNPWSENQRLTRLGDNISTQDKFMNFLSEMTGGIGLREARVTPQSDLAYANLFESGYNPPQVSLKTGYNFHGTYRTLTRPEAQRLDALTGQYFKSNLTALGDISQLPETARWSAAQQAHEQARDKATTEIGATPIDRGGQRGVAGAAVPKAPVRTRTRKISVLRGGGVARRPRGVTLRIPKVKVARIKMRRSRASRRLFSPFRSPKRIRLRGTRVRTRRRRSVLA